LPTGPVIKFNVHTSRLAPCIAGPENDEPSSELSASQPIFYQPTIGM
jgi:hypothetical protein